MNNTLLAVVGLSPQVITETLYALNQMNRPVRHMHIITTRPGKDVLLSQLLDGGKGPYYRFLEEYATPDGGMDFGPANIHVVRDQHGIELEDITDENDNARLLELCMQKTFELTRDPHRTLFFSIAGGRKTMGACLTLAAQMYGRPRDRLYHVLVSAEFESNRAFFYPPQQSEPIELRDKNGQPYYKETRYARITLVPMPFFSIRSQLTAEVLDQPRDPATLMLSLIRETPETLVINIKEGKLRYLGMEMDMMANRLALYAFFALLKKECPLPDASCKACDACFIDLDELSRRQPDITRLYKQLCGSRPLEEMSTTGILGLDADNFKSLKSRIKKDLETGFGPMAAAKLRIVKTGERTAYRYGLAVTRESIEVVM